MSRHVAWVLLDTAINGDPVVVGVYTTRIKAHRAASDRKLDRYPDGFAIEKFTLNAPAVNQWLMR